ncbi:MAG: TonB-dependent receptor [Halioglobus sp.]|nr:TonB-dependent receptor [Halioglobus sp.]
MPRLTRFAAIPLSAAVAASSIGLAPGQAQAALTLEEVVVTARKREESLQETPIAVSAFTGDNLEELGMRDIADLRKVAPNVDLYDGNGTGGAGNVFIRGVGARNTGVNFDSGVGIYVDGVYVSRPDGAVLDNVDIQSVQVLRGPQGTLFGKNTTGGAILYTTNKPIEEFEAKAEVRLGNYNQQDGKLTVNVPLVDDTLLSRVSVYSTTRDGYVESRSNGRPGLSNNDEFSNVNRFGGQAQLRWLASESLTADLNYSYAKTDQAARGQNCEVVEGIEGAGWQAGLQDPFIVIPSTGQSLIDWCQENDDLGRDKIQAQLSPNKYEAEVQSLALTFDWEMDNGINFKSITSGRYTEAGASNELDAIGIPNLGRTNYGPGTELRESDQFSQEFQFSGTALDDKLEYVFGIFGFHEESDGGSQISPSGPFFGALSQPNLAFYINQTLNLDTRNTSASAFSQTDWNISDNWRLTLGIRYTWEERKLTRRFRVPDLATLASTGDAMTSPIADTFFSFPSGPDSFNLNHGYVKAMDPDNPGQVDPLADQTMRTDDDDITPMASIQYTFDDMGFIDGGTAYFTIANGFLSGGITDTVSVSTRMIEEYKPEEVWNYEIGLKLDAWDNRLRLNTAIFHTEYEDRQLTTVRINPDTGRIAGALINAESSSISGIEIETQVIPVDNFQITANITFNEGEIDDYADERILASPDTPVPDGCSRITVGLSTVDNCPIDRSDENLPRLPEEIYFLSMQYFLETDIGSIVPMVSWSYRKNVDNCFDRASCLSGLYEVDQEELSARLTWTSPDENIRVTAYGNNLTDERYITGGTPLVDVTETAGTIYNLPRTYGIEAAYKF